MQVYTLTLVEQYPGMPELLGIYDSMDAVVARLKQQASCVDVGDKYIVEVCPLESANKGG
jgi:hypothetical protein